MSDTRELISTRLFTVLNGLPRVADADGLAAELTEPIANLIETDLFKPGDLIPTASGECMVVPVEPTERMKQVGGEDLSIMNQITMLEDRPSDYAEGVYASMIKATGEET